MKKRKETWIEKLIDDEYLGQLKKKWEDKAFEKGFDRGFEAGKEAVHAVKHIKEISNTLESL